MDVPHCIFEEYDLHVLSGVMSAFGVDLSSSVSQESIQSFIAPAEMNVPESARSRAALMAARFKALASSIERIARTAS